MPATDRQRVRPWAGSRVLRGRSAPSLAYRAARTRAPGQAWRRFRVPPRRASVVRWARRSVGLTVVVVAVGVVAGAVEPLRRVVARAPPGAGAGGAGGAAGGGGGVGAGGGGGAGRVRPGGGGGVVAGGCVGGGGAGAGAGRTGAAGCCGTPGAAARTGAGGSAGIVCAWVAGCESKNVPRPEGTTCHCGLPAGMLALRAAAAAAAS